MNYLVLSSRSAALILALGLILICVGGCNNKDIGNPFPKPAAVVVIVDRSVAGYQPREDQFQEIDSLAKSAGEAQSTFALWSYDSTAKCLWGPDPIPTTDMLDSAENNDLRRVSASSKLGSRPDIAIDAVMHDPVIDAVFGRVYILSDGRDTSPTSLAVLSSSVRELSAKKGWRLAVLGITPQNRALWQAASASTMADRTDLVDQKTALSTLAENRDE